MSLLDDQHRYRDRIIGLQRRAGWSDRTLLFLLLEHLTLPQMEELQESLKVVEQTETQVKLDALLNPNDRFETRLHGSLPGETISVFVHRSQKQFICYAVQTDVLTEQHRGASSLHDSLPSAMCAARRMIRKLVLCGWESPKPIDQFEEDTLPRPK